MKLTKLQQEVIDYMKKGWELGSSTAISSRSWLQKDGLGRGGETRNVNGNTVSALCEKGLIQQKYGYPTKKWFLDKRRKNKNEN